MVSVPVSPGGTYIRLVRKRGSMSSGESQEVTRSSEAVAVAEAVAMVEESAFQNAGGPPSGKNKRTNDNRNKRAQKRNNEK